MLCPFKKIFSNGKVINIKNKKHRKKTAVSDNIHEKSIFEIQKAFSIGENTTLVCGEVLKGSFRIGDTVRIYGHKTDIPKLEGKIERMTTSLVEVNKIRKGVKTDMLIDAKINEEDKIFPGNKIYKV